MAEPSFQVSPLPIPTTFVLAQAPPAISRFIYQREALQQTPGHEIHENTSPAGQASDDHQPSGSPQIPPPSTYRYRHAPGAIHMAWTSSITPKPCRTACGLSLDNSSILGQVDVSLLQTPRLCVRSRSGRRPTGVAYLQETSSAA